MVLMKTENILDNEQLQEQEKTVSVIPTPKDMVSQLHQILL